MSTVIDNVNFVNRGRAFTNSLQRMVDKGMLDKSVLQEATALLMSAGEAYFVLGMVEAYNNNLPLDPLGESDLGQGILLRIKGFVPSIDVTM